MAELIATRILLSSDKTSLDAILTDAEKCEALSRVLGYLSPRSR